MNMQHKCRCCKVAIPKESLRRNIHGRIFGLCPNCGELKLLSWHDIKSPIVFRKTKYGFNVERRNNKMNPHIYTHFYTHPRSEVFQMKVTEPTSTGVISFGFAIRNNKSNSTIGIIWFEQLMCPELELVF